MIDPLPPALDMWVFAGAGGGALLTWMAMRVARGSAYQHGYDHGRSESDHELATRLAALEREHALLQEALARCRAERARLAPPPGDDGAAGQAPPPHR